MATTGTSIEKDLARRTADATPAFLTDSPKKLLLGAKWVAAESEKTLLNNQPGN